MKKRYQFLAIYALDQGMISEGEFARFLHVDRVKAREIAVTLREETDNLENGYAGDLTTLAEESLGD